MMALLVLETKLKNIYSKYSIWIKLLLKFIVGLSVALVVETTMPYNQTISDHSMLFAFIVAFLCALTPDSIGVLIVSLVVILEVGATSYVLAFVFFAAVAIYILLFGRFDKGQSLFIVFLLVFWGFEQPFAVPIIAGLLVSVTYVPACITGVLLHYIIAGIKEYHVASLSSAETKSQVEGFRFLVDYIITNREMALYMLLFSVVLCVVYILRRGSYNYASYIAIAVGIIVTALGLITGDTFFETKTDLAKMLISMLIAAVLAVIVQFFRLNLNYSGVRMLQFHDDEYYYYVKAVPKIKVEAKDKTVTKIKDLEPDAIDLKDQIEKTLEEDLES